ncbi:MAG: hypothetical protein ACT4PW_10115 [Acidimicrobiia bacterium]
MDFVDERTAPLVVRAFIARKLLFAAFLAALFGILTQAFTTLGYVLAGLSAAGLAALDPVVTTMLKRLCPGLERPRAHQVMSWRWARAAAGVLGLDHRPLWLLRLATFVVAVAAVMAGLSRAEVYP